MWASCRAGWARVPARCWRWRWWLSLLGIVALSGHVYWWYWPRVHAASPPAGSVLTAWLQGQGHSEAHWPMVAWLPYPHQNLAVLSERAGLEPETLAAFGRLAGLPEPTLPSFGALPLPPASAMALASDKDGRHFVLAAEVYPAFAVFSRFAGWLADNTFLAGGTLIVEDRRLEVAWFGNVWTVSSPDPLPPGWLDEAATLEPPLEPSLLVVRIDRSLEWVPSGLYHLQFDPAKTHFELRSATAIPHELLRIEEEVGAGAASETRKNSPYLLAFAGPLNEAPTSQALAFFSHDDPKSHDLPRVAVYFQDAAQRWELPAEGLLDFLGQKPLVASSGAWQMATFEEKSLEGSRRLLPLVEALDRRQGSRHLRLGLWLELGPATHEVERIGRMVDQAPWIPQRKVDRWHDIETVLRAVAERFRGLSLVIAEAPAALSLRLEGRPTPAETVQ